MKPIKKEALEFTNSLLRVIACMVVMSLSVGEVFNQAIHNHTAPLFFYLGCSLVAYAIFKMDYDAMQVLFAKEESERDKENH